MEPVVLSEVIRFGFWSKLQCSCRKSFANMFFFFFVGDDQVPPPLLTLVEQQLAKICVRRDLKIWRSAALDGIAAKTSVTKMSAAAAERTCC